MKAVCSDELTAVRWAGLTVDEKEMSLVEKRESSMADWLVAVMVAKMAYSKVVC